MIGRLERTWKWVKRNPVVTGAAAAGGKRDAKLIETHPDFKPLHGRDDF